MVITGRVESGLLGRLQPGSETKAEGPPRLVGVGLFAGIAGFEYGFRQQGHSTVALCESDPAARRVLADRFPEAKLINDIRSLASIPECDFVTAGFPCQDLSPAGRTQGIKGEDSGLINEVFRLLKGLSTRTKWLILENVPFMLRLHRGFAIRYVTDSLSRLGWNWAYRTIDTQAFGLPQRRLRLFIVASRTEDPRPVLFNSDAEVLLNGHKRKCAKGFYWTEGHRGLGWAENAVPPLKGGSGLSIPSPPAVWLPKRFVVPTIEAAERLQGFPAGWTEAACLEPTGDRHRWRLVGNAVSVPVAHWLASRLSAETEYDDSADTPLAVDQLWPTAAAKVHGQLTISRASAWPVRRPTEPLESFLGDQTKPLSLKAAAGFLSRLEHSSLHRNEPFISALRRYVVSMNMKKGDAAPDRPTDVNVSRRMANTRGRDNAAEKAIRSTLHANGYRFRVHTRAIPELRRTIDIAFPSLRIAVFVDGCFWHGCPIHGTWPKRNGKWWKEKIEANMRRDIDTNNRLKSLGWTVVRVWEHERVDVAAKRIMRSLEAKLSRTRATKKPRIKTGPRR